MILLEVELLYHQYEVDIIYINIGYRVVDLKVNESTLMFTICQFNGWEIRNFCNGFIAI